MSYSLYPFVEKYAPIRFFILPSTSMENTVFRGDYLIAERTKDVKRDDVVIFRYPLRPDTFFIKRVVAVGGDELVYQDKKLFIHFHEGDAFIQKNYSSDEIVSFRDKLWVKNPYMRQHKGINYKPTHNCAFKNLLLRPNDMEAIYIKKLGGVVYEKKNHEKMNAFYTKVDENNYFVLGDNRDNSSDSRFWGAVPKENIFGLGKRVYFNIYSFDRFLVDVE